MAGNWRYVKLEDIAADKDRPFAMGPFGSNIRAVNYRESGIPVIRGINLGKPGEPRFESDDFTFLTEAKANELSSSSAYPKDVVFVAQGTVGKVGIVPSDTPYEQFILSQNLMKVTLNEDVADPLFVFYYFRSREGQHEILSYVNPTGVPCISKPLTSLRQFKVRLPSDVKEQKAIACILGALDDKIEFNRRMNQTLEAITRTIFESWFVAFDPVISKAGKQSPSGMTPEVADCFPDAFINLESGSMPMGWQMHQLNEVCEFAYGKALKASDRVSGHIAVMGSNGQVGWHNEALVAGPGVVVGRKGNPGIVTWVHRDFYPIDTTFYVVPTMKDMPLTFLYEAIKKLNLPKLSSDSAVPGLNRNFAYMSRIVVPTTDVLRAFDRQATPLYQRRFIADEQTHLLIEIRDALLPQLIDGLIGLEKAEQIVGRCT
ncbi:MAG: restriction endonuclease subunit S [Candidatus Abyssobacteria bacterium SURF_5]|uniref:Restriction endonuclease subunit S n=1 Tax=Abyssobacteria bacterium (strain SURF_5) TaxID=2093360 RepID=A0A3A4NMZ4_ABYX5|nr:MAG: restriction endonuclease subunit S [Candidatus Abyssubacteria bacterium SURF_5]